MPMPPPITPPSIPCLAVELRPGYTGVGEEVEEELILVTLVGLLTLGFTTADVGPF